MILYYIIRYINLFLLTFAHCNVMTSKWKNENKQSACILVARIPATLVKLSDRILFPLRAAKSISHPVGRNIHPSDAADQQRDERVEGSERILGRKNQDISARWIIRWIYSGTTFSLSHPTQGSRLKAETHSGLQGVTFLPLCLSLVGSYTYS